MYSDLNPRLGSRQIALVHQTSIIIIVIIICNDDDNCVFTMPHSISRKVPTVVGQCAWYGRYSKSRSLYAVSLQRRARESGTTPLQPVFIYCSSICLWDTGLFKYLLFNFCYSSLYSFTFFLSVCLSFFVQSVHLFVSTFFPLSFAFTNFLSIGLVSHWLFYCHISYAVHSCIYCLFM